MNLAALAQKYDAFESVDRSSFQRKARILQSMWRTEHGFECGVHKGHSSERLLGSRLVMPEARQELHGFLTENIRSVVRNEVLNKHRAKGKLYGKPRIFNDLLSSQPLCFNLFGELTRDTSVLTTVVNTLTDSRFSEVEDVWFEHSPGRSDESYLGDRSAFDVYLPCRQRNGRCGFIGIEVKYHENLRGAAGKHKSRYDEVADQMGCFPTDRSRLKQAPLQQIWRDHLLAGSIKNHDSLDDALFVILYPKDNPDVSCAMSRYRDELTDLSSFAAWTLEDFVAMLRSHCDQEWIELFHDRYLAFEKVNDRLHE